MFNLEEFRVGQYGLPFSGADELPACCFNCVYLCHEESTVCFCDSPFYYYCCYSWPDKLTDTVPPCLQYKEEAWPSKKSSWDGQSHPTWLKNQGLIQVPEGLLWKVLRVLPVYILLASWRLGVRNISRQGAKNAKGLLSLQLFMFSGVP